MKNFHKALDQRLVFKQWISFLITKSMIGKSTETIEIHNS